MRRERARIPRSSRARRDRRAAGARAHRDRRPPAAPARGTGRWHRRARYSSARRGCAPPGCALLRANHEGLHALDHQPEARLRRHAAIRRPTAARSSGASEPGCACETWGGSSGCSGRLAAAGDQRAAAGQQFGARQVPSGRGLELDGSAIGHQRKIQPTVLDRGKNEHAATVEPARRARNPPDTCARVNASGPNSRFPGPEDFQLPRPRLQSKRTLSTTLGAEADGVARALDRGTRGAVAHVDLHQAPGSSFEAGGCCGRTLPARWRRRRSTPPRQHWPSSQAPARGVHLESGSRAESSASRSRPAQVVNACSASFEVLCSLAISRLPHVSTAIAIGDARQHGAACRIPQFSDQAHVRRRNHVLPPAAAAAALAGHEVQVDDCGMTRSTSGAGALDDGVTALLQLGRKLRAKQDCARQGAGCRRPLPAREFPAAAAASRLEGDIHARRASRADNAPAKARAPRRRCRHGCRAPSPGRQGWSDRRSAR